MNAQEWSKLKKNWSCLLEMYPSDVIPELFAAGAITTNDKEKVHKAGTMKEQMEKLLSILKSKHPEQKTFDAFMQVLEVKASWLAEKIKSTETSSDPSLKSQVDPHLLDPEVREILHKNFASIPRVSIKLTDVREVLHACHVFSGKNEWSNDYLLGFVKEEYLGVESEKKKIRYGNKKKEVIYLKNIAKIDPAVTETVTAAEQKQEIGPTVASSFREIKGTEKMVYEKEISSSSIKEHIQNATKPSVPSGSSVPSDYDALHPEPKVYAEYLLKFDSNVTHMDKYIKGHCVDVSRNVRGRKTIPLRNFHLIQGQDKDRLLEFIGSEVVPFAASCLNDRRNGTVYFGINPAEHDHYRVGEITGMNIVKEEVRDQINEFLKTSFFPTQYDIISNTVRDPRFVPVVSDICQEQDPNLWVIEVDVVPSSAVMKTDIVKTKLKWLPIYAKKHKLREAVFRFSDDGDPKVISTDALHSYEREQNRIIRQRQVEETQMNVSPPQNLRTKLLNLLTGGNEVMQDNIFPFFVISPVDTHMDRNYLSKNMLFITQLKPEVVYDFDPAGSTEGIYKCLDENEIIRVLTTDNFNKSKLSREHYKEFTDSLESETKISWMFCNGYEELNLKSLEPTEWNRQRNKDFRASLQFFIRNFEERIIFIICLFSKNYKAMIEACDEILTQLPENWILLAESEDIAKLWQDQVFARNKAERKAVIDRCIVGMTWEHINLTLCQVMDNNVSLNQCHLPTSSGAFVPVRKKKLKDWSDIDVLTAGEFDVREDERERKRKEVEVQFYRGEQAAWLNFYFGDQVLKRAVHEKLMKATKRALKGENEVEEDMVTYVSVLHHPGAGGTTSAKQVLWELRKEYRCCVVKTITNQTSDQLDEIRRFNDPAPKPLLIMIDNEDEDKFIQLRGSLEEKGRQCWRHADESFNVYCTIILCERRATLPAYIKDHQVSLRQELTTGELYWFKEKNESLESDFKQNKDTNFNPKFLISFNILRENFNKKYISKVVKEFCDDIKSEVEIKLLKIISLLNTYDPEFKAVRVPSLDRIIGHGHNQVSLNRNAVKRNMNWEANLSQGVRVLLNLSSNRTQPGKSRSSVRVFNKIIAQEIWNQMKERTKEKESTVMHEILKSEIFEQESSDAKHLQIIINNVMKKREFELDGIRNKFSKFVNCVMDEDADVAAELLEELFECNQDPFTAQLIARFYIHFKNWSKAEVFAKKATSILPSSSFLWDTHGQVYKHQMFEKIQPSNMKDDDIHEVIKLCKKCIEAFKKEQTVSEREFTTNGDNNFAGYFGELRSIILLLNALNMCPSFSAGNILHQYLVSDHFRPKQLRFLDSHETYFLKNLERNSKETMRRLDEEYLQMKGNLSLVNSSRPSPEYDKKWLLYLKANLDHYFGENSDNVPQNLTESDACEYLRRRARQLGAASLNNLLSSRQKENTAVIKQAYSLILKNVQSPSCTADDLRMVLDIVTVLLIDNFIPEGLIYPSVLEWCKKLYAKGRQQQTDRWYLEIFLYYVLYNFPTEERKEYMLCSTADLSNAVKNWHDAFRKNYPKSAEEEIKLKRRETTLFFLGNGLPLQDIVHQDSLDNMEYYNRQQKWEVPEIRQKLRMMSGTLLERGEKVEIVITSRDGNKIRFPILTSHQVRKKDMWQKKVYFYLGFSFSGPMAFGMSTEELGVTELPKPRRRQQSSFLVTPARQHGTLILFDLYAEKLEIEAQLINVHHSSKQRADLLKKIQQIEKDIKNFMGL